MKYKIFHISLLLAWFICFALGAQSTVETKTIVRAFRVSPTSKISVSNKYGNLRVELWDKDSIRFEITQTINEKNPVKLAKIRDNISYRFAQIPSGLEVQTLFSEKHSSLIKNVKEATNYLDPQNLQSRINYKITMPTYINLTLELKYGDIILPTLSGNITIDLSNGNLQTGDFNATLNLKQSFGNAYLKKIAQGDLDLNFVELQCESSNNLLINTKSSTIIIDQCGTLRIDSRRDQLTIQNVDELFLTTYFSTIRQLDINKTGQLNFQYGKVSNLSASRELTKLIIDSRMCDVNLKMISPKSYTAVIQAKNTQINLPTDLKPLLSNYKYTIENNPVNFQFGKEPFQSQLIINNSDSDLTISHK